MSSYAMITGLDMLRQIIHVWLLGFTIYTRESRARSRGCRDEERQGRAIASLLAFSSWVYIKQFQAALFLSQQRKPTSD